MNLVVMLDRKSMLVTSSVLQTLGSKCIQTRTQLDCDMIYSFCKHVILESRAKASSSQPLLHPDRENAADLFHHSKVTHVFLGNLHAYSIHTRVEIFT